MDTTNEPQESTVASGDQGQGEGAKKKRRRRRGKRREGQGPANAADQVTDGPEADDDGDDDATPSTSTGDPSGEAPAKKKRRRKKKRSPSDLPAAVDGEQPQPAQQQAPPAQQRREPREPREPQQPRQRPTGDKTEKGPRERRGRERKEPARPQPVLGRIVKTELLREDTQNEPILPPVRQAATTVDGYVSNHKGWQREVLMRLREIIRTVAPDFEESIKWSQPVYEFNGPACYLKAFTDHINLGFWRGTELSDPDGLLVGDGVKMRHVTMRSANDVKREAFEAFIKQALKLNREKGDPTQS